MKRPGIYAIVHVESGRRYVGSTVDLTNRLRQHRQNLAKGQHENAHLLRAWAKHGAGAFVFVELETVEDVNRLHEREQACLDAAQPNVYNIGKVARAPWLGVKRGPQSVEWRRKISAANAGRPKPPFSAEHRAKMSAARRGKPNPMTPEHRAKLLAVRQSRRGRRMSVESRRRMSDARKGRTFGPMSAEAREHIRAAALKREAAKRARREEAA